MVFGGHRGYVPTRWLYLEVKQEEEQRRALLYLKERSMRVKSLPISRLGGTCLTYNSIASRMGENLLALTAPGRPLMKYRENTIRSFNTAAAAGASFVEFDVQVLFEILLQKVFFPEQNLRNSMPSTDLPLHVYVGYQGRYSSHLA